MSTDLGIIEKLEKNYNIKLRKLYKLQFGKAGYYTDEDNNIIFLSLSQLEINNYKSMYRFEYEYESLFLEDLKNLTKLDLSKTCISDLSFLEDLKNLIELNLSNSYISGDISFLKGLKNLTKLDLSDNHISDYSYLEGLTNLTKLDLSDNHISDYSFLKSLTSLTRLGLGLRNCQYGAISRLMLSDQRRISKQARKLALDIKQISCISFLKNLTELDLNGNFISDISFLKDLTNLTKLDLSRNFISDISFLKDLTNLTKLDLRSNSVKKLPIEITNLTVRIKWSYDYTDKGIFLEDNPLESPPIEIIMQGNKALKNYFGQLEKQGKDFIYEAKLMLVGEPGSGKTTLMNLLFDKDFHVPNKKQKSTLGIDVRQNWKFSTNDKKDFSAHIWDFGGQQIQYMLHQFFLTSDCIYVLMAEKRRELANFDYWLNIINLLGRNSPVIILFNEINIDYVASFIYDEKKYIELFPELKLQRQDVNLADIRDGRFDVLLNIIQNKLRKLEHIGKEVPARWVDIRMELEKRKEKKYIKINQYFEICRKYKIEKEEDQMLILQYFHLLGIVLYFREDENLRDTLFLDHNWVVDAVYSVLADKKLEKSNGFIKKSDIEKIWSEEKYDFEERSKLLQLMLKDNFELCYKLPGMKDTYIIPLLLSPKKPEYNWDNNNNLQFRFQYPFMPKGIVSRLIVRMHEHVNQGTVWNEGVVFRRNGAIAQVIEKKTVNEGLKIIEIRLDGALNSRKDFLTLICEEIKKIQNSSFPNLPYVEMVPCYCKECTIAETPYFFNYRDIETYLQKEKTKIDCRKSTKEVSIGVLIGNVFDSEEIELRQKKIRDESKEKYEKGYINIHQTFQETIMGDTYDVSGQAGAVGKGSHAHDINFNQIWNQTSNNIDLDVLAKELSDLRKELRSNAETPDQDLAVGAVASAEIAAQNGDGPKALEWLSKSGKWTFDVATKIGAGVATAALKTALGL